MICIQVYVHDCDDSLIRVVLQVDADHVSVETAQKDTSETDTTARHADVNVS